MLDGDESSVNGGGIWSNRKGQHRARIYDDPEELWARACEYFAWCDDHPWRRVDLVKFQGSASQEYLPLGRPYSMEGLTIHLGVAVSYFRTAEKELSDKAEKHRATVNEREILYTIQYIRSVVRTQQIEGAAVGVFNASLVARLTGLVDRQDVTSNGEQMVNVVVRDDATAKVLRELDDML